MNSCKKEVAKILLESGCLKISGNNPFTYASGLKGPIYCDNRILLSKVDSRKKITQYFHDQLSNLNEGFDLIAAMATGAIAHGAFLAQLLDRPLVYIRSKAKEYGQKNLIEGGEVRGKRVILIEDLINQGSSIEIGLDELKKSGSLVLKCFCIVDYQMQRAKDVLNAKNCPVESLTDFSNIISYAIENHLIQELEYQMILKWHRDPLNWQ